MMSKLSNIPAMLSSYSHHYEGATKAVVMVFFLAALFRKAFLKKAAGDTRSSKQTSPTSTLTYPYANRRLCQLHPFEEKNVILEGAVSTITWFEGDAANTASGLRARVKEIVRLNPWLVGKLVKEPVLSISFDETDTLAESAIDGVFSFHEDAHYDLRFHLGTPLPDLAETALKKGFICQSSTDILKKGLPFIKVTVIRDSSIQYKRFALLVSLQTLCFTRVTRTSRW